MYFSVSSKTVSVPSLRTGPRPYRLATACLATLCAVLLLSIIAASTHCEYIHSKHTALETVKVTAPIAAPRELRTRKEDLVKERDELLTCPHHHCHLRQPRWPFQTPVTCPRDWLVLNSSCYYISTRSMHWHNIQDSFMEIGGHLAIVHTAEEQTLLLDQLPLSHWNANWFGINDETAEADWKPCFSLCSFWEEGEPNNHIDEDSVTSWYDAPCTMYWPFICEIEMQTSVPAT
uniref:C-type lectin domain-containing protein n=1 Tax=Oncorhynchus kisutch TaxID=8019 RepID=A0A8C7GRS4_ONCKI